METVTYNILFIEDNQADARLVQEYLSTDWNGEPSYQLNHFETLTEGLAYLEEFEVDLVLLDLGLPDGDGLELLKRLHTRHPLLPIIVLTGRDSRALALDVVRCGAQDYLHKAELNEHVLERAIHYGLERKRAEQQLRLQSMALQAAANAIVIADYDGHVIWCNDAFTVLTGYASEEILGESLRMLRSGQHDEDFYTEIWDTILAGETWHGELVSRHKDGSHYTEEQTITPVTDHHGQITHFVAIKSDITERKALHQQLVQAQKLESIGQLAAGIAHEINTPIQYIGDNSRFLKDIFGEVRELLEYFEAFVGAAEQVPMGPEQVAEAREVLDEADLEYMFDDIPQAIEQSIEGIQRVAKIVQAMKAFSHPGSEEKSLVDLNKALQTTITIARNEWKYVSEIETHLTSNLPMVPGFPGELNQVFLNLIVNAAHAIQERLGNAEEKGCITVGTRMLGEAVEVFITDTGNGIPEHAQERIFDPFFTTKEVGKGTGQGLSIAHNVVVDKHGGDIGFETAQGVGTTFKIRLPLHSGDGASGDGAAYADPPTL